MFFSQVGAGLASFGVDAGSTARSVIGFVCCSPVVSASTVLHRRSRFTVRASKNYRKPVASSYQRPNPSFERTCAKSRAVRSIQTLVRMKFPINFEHKFGWSELLSAIALLVSLVALWYARAQVTQNLPDVLVETQTAIRLFSTTQGSQSEWVSLLPFVVTNRGGRTVTLVKFVREDLPPVLRINDELITENKELDVSFALTEGVTDSKDFIQSKALSVETRPLSLPHVINESIDSGKARSFVMIVRMKDKNNRSLQGSKILFSCKAVFSDGTTYRIAQGLGYE